MSPERKLSPKQQEIVEISQNFADITRKWGRPIFGDDNHLVFSPTFLDIKGDWVITCSTDIKNPTIVIKNGFSDVKQLDLNGNNGAYFEIPERTRILTTDTGISVPLLMNSGALIIENDVDTEKMVRELEMVDRKANEIGLIVNGARQEIIEKSYFVPQKRKVDEVFSDKGAMLLVPNGMFDDELKTFDHPEKLVIWLDPLMGGSPNIIKKDDINYLNKKAELITKTLKKYNLNPAMIMEMSAASIEKNDVITTRHIMAIMKIVQDEVKQELKKYKDL